MGPSDPAPTAVRVTRRVDQRDRRRSGPRAVLVALLALLVLAVSGTWVAWGGQLRQLARADAPAAPATDQGGGFRPGAAAEPDDHAGDRGTHDRTDRTGHADDGRGAYAQRGDDHETSDGGSDEGEGDS